MGETPVSAQSEPYTSLGAGHRLGVEPGEQQATCRRQPHGGAAWRRRQQSRAEAAAQHQNRGEAAATG